MSHIIHFEIHADDLDRARDFYHNVFGWKHEKNEDADEWRFVTGSMDKPGLMGTLRKRSNKPAPGGFSTYVSTIGVDNLDEMVKRIEQHKGNCVRPKYAVKGVGWCTHCIDTEGNVFGLMQYDKNAA